jgi:ribosome-associated protein
MDIKKLQALVIDALEDVKAQDIKVFDTSHLTSLFDRIAVASGTSNRQTKALASSVRDKVKENGGQILSIEGEGTGEWVLVDLGDMIVHIMQPAIRAYYRLEEIWGEKEVKLGAAKRIATASKNAGAVVPRKVSRHLTTSQVEALPVIEKAGSPSPSIKKISTRKPAAKKTAAKKVAGKSIVAKKSASKKLPVQKITLKTPVAKKPRAAAAKSSPAKSGKPASKPASKSAAKPAAKRSPAKPKAK